MQTGPRAGAKRGGPGCRGSHFRSHTIFSISLDSTYNISSDPHDFHRLFVSQNPGLRWLRTGHLWASGLTLFITSSALCCTAVLLDHALGDRRLAGLVLWTYAVVAGPVIMAIITYIVIGTGPKSWNSLGFSLGTDWFVFILGSGPVILYFAICSAYLLTSKAVN